MKSIKIIVAISAITLILFSACSEEDIQPKTNDAEQLQDTEIGGGHIPPE